MGTLLRDKTDVALALVTGLFREGGATVSPRANETVPATGYMVGGAAEPYVIHRKALQPFDVLSWLDRTHVPEGAYVGSWEDEGLVYFDVSEHYWNADNALLVAHSRGEKAIWDLRNATEITTTEKVA